MAIYWIKLEILGSIKYVFSTGCYNILKISCLMHRVRHNTDVPQLCSMTEFVEIPTNPITYH